MVKRVVRKPVEKLSDKENVMIIDSSSEDESSSDEENFVVEIPKQNVITKPSNKIPCDICGKEYSKGGIRMHRISCEKKQGSVAPPIPIQKKQVAPEIDEDDKPMTARQMKAFLAAQNPPVVKKPRKPYTRKPKVEPAPPTAEPLQPTPPSTPRNNTQPQIRWA
jgi:hypothetical protein|tara:strand:+ start:328 stop:819 length:492 start_codon:yes stop_codon:yes gene_type:complete